MPAPVRRPYRSPLRREHADKTREKILDGLVRTMAGGVADLSVPAIAGEAGVSVPTVYRHFRTKKALVEAVAAHVGHKTGTMDMPKPRDPNELAGSVETLFRRLDGMSDTIRVAMASELGARIRRSTLLPERVRLIEAALGPALRGRSRADRVRLRNVVLVLWSSATLRAFKDYLGASVEEAADNVAWAIRTLVAGAQRGA